MSLFDKISHAIFGDRGPIGEFGSYPHTTAEPAELAHPAPAPQPSAAPQPAPAAIPAPPADVAAILTQKEQAAGTPSHWRTSIVDLLTLLGLDSSLAARKELADDLGVHAGADGSAEQNVALHRAVMKKLAENGGQVPADLLG